MTSEQLDELLREGVVECVPRDRAAYEAVLVERVDVQEAVAYAQSVVAAVEADLS